MLFLGESDEPFQPTKASKNLKLLVQVCDALEDKESPTLRCCLVMQTQARLQSTKTPANRRQRHGYGATQHSKVGWVEHHDWL